MDNSPFPDLSEDILQVTFRYIAEIQSLKTEVQSLKNRVAYLEYDLHAENGRLRDRLREEMQQPDDSYDCDRSYADSWESEESDERLGNL